MEVLSYEFSEILKELGFKGYTAHYYEFGNNQLWNMEYIEYEILPAPSYLQAFVFLLDLANQGIEPNSFIITIPNFDLIHIRDNQSEIVTSGSNECVAKLISIVNNK